jgi:cytochrome c553
MARVRLAVVGLTGWATCLPVLSLSFVSLSVLAQSPDETRLKALGQHLARECVTCHRLDGSDNGIPSIVAWKVDDFIDTMGFYKRGQRPNQAMISVAQSLDDEQTKALALWFAAQTPPARKTPATAPAKKK